MPPTCNICEDNKIDFNCRCYMCKKSVCIECYGEIINRETYNKYIYSCPYCKTKNMKEILDLDKQNIIKVCTKDYNDDNDYLLFIEEIQWLRSEISMRDAYNDKLKNEICKLKDEISTSKMNVINDYSKKSPKKNLSKYNLFVREKFPELKAKFPDMPTKEIMKNIGRLWSTSKKND